jgi:hypothetical protein
MPVQRIPEKEPWCRGTELSASEKTIDHMTESQKPRSMKA